jgi:dUTP pyrophosphatase
LTPLTAGFDLFSVNSLTIAPGKEMIVNTGLRIAMPRGTYGRIACLTSLAVVHQVQIGAGVINADYRGIVKVLMINRGQTPFVVRPGDKIAQLICEKISYPELTEVDDLGPREDHVSFAISSDDEEDQTVPE